MVSTENSVLEWLREPWKRLNQGRVQGRLPHALLISAAAGTGKRDLAQRLAFALLCENPDPAGTPCGTCSSCGWLQAGTHPDLLWLEPEESGKAIKVDQIRALCTELGMTSHGGRYKVAILVSAEAMNVNAANSLLKTLEEPTDNTLIILLSASPGRLPATVRSRCQQIVISVPAPELAMEWLISQGVDAAQASDCLKLSGGAPLRALECVTQGRGEQRRKCLEQVQQVISGHLDPLQLAQEWGAEAGTETLEWWRDWLQDLIRWRQAGTPVVEEHMAQKLRQILKTVDCRELYQLLDQIVFALNSLGSGLNRPLIMEELLIVWAGMADSHQNRFLSDNR